MAKYEEFLDNKKPRVETNGTLPLQLETIERCVRLWTNPGERVFSPFAGIGSEGYVALKHEREFIGIELKRTYYDIARDNLRAAKAQLDLFGEA